jgi:predicted  nucleic acid-binding Zn-ribbon protein
MNEDRKIDEAFLAEMMKRGKKAWEDVPDATAWVEELRTDMTQNKMNDTPTPITDALMPTQENGRTLYDHAQIMETHARQLERELAEAKENIEMLEIRHGATMLCHEAQMHEVTKQRDALAEALREIASGAYSWKTCVDVIAPKALAATKGGKP